MDRGPNPAIERLKSIMRGKTTNHRGAPDRITYIASAMVERIDFEQVRNSELRSDVQRERLKRELIENAERKARARLAGDEAAAATLNTLATKPIDNLAEIVALCADSLPSDSMEYNDIGMALAELINDNPEANLPDLLAKLQPAETEEQLKARAKVEEERDKRKKELEKSGLTKEQALKQANKEMVQKAAKKDADREEGKPQAHSPIDEYVNQSKLQGPNRMMIATIAILFTPLEAIALLCHCSNMLKIEIEGLQIKLKNLNAQINAELEKGDTKNIELLAKLNAKKTKLEGELKTKFDEAGLNVKLEDYATHKVRLTSLNKAALGLLGLLLAGTTMPLFMTGLATAALPLAVKYCSIFPALASDRFWVKMDGYFAKELGSTVFEKNYRSAGGNQPAMTDDEAQATLAQQQQAQAAARAAAVVQPARTPALPR